MSTDIENVIGEKVRALPFERQQEVLEFVERIEMSAAAPRRTLGELADELLKDVPREVIEQLPVDGAENHDHYLYGARKK
ncbi:MAG: hypothetical protein M3430_12590 [Acidobacteriota bacterium]|nr:hypothetical protein [Acidobacteriota bacterium]